MSEADLYVIDDPHSHLDFTRKGYKRLNQLMSGIVSGVADAEWNFRADIEEWMRRMHDHTASRVFEEGKIPEEACENAQFDILNELIYRMQQSKDIQAWTRFRTFFVLKLKRRYERLRERDLQPVSLDEEMPNIYAEPRVIEEEFLGFDKATEPACVPLHEMILAAPYTSEKSYQRRIDEIEVVLGTLTTSEYTVIKLRYGFVDGVCLTQEEIGRRYNTSLVNISRIERCAMAKLRHPVRVKKLSEFVENME